MKIYWAVILTAATMLSAVGLVSTGAWLISSAALMPPILVLQVAIVAVRFFGISRGVFRWSERVVSHDVALSGTTALRVKLWKVAAELGPLGVWRLRGSDALDRLTSDTDLMQDEVTRVRTPMLAALVSATLLTILQFLILPLAGVAFAVSFVLSGWAIPKAIYRIELRVAKDAVEVRNRISSLVYQVVNNSGQLRLLDQAEIKVNELRSADQERILIESRTSLLAGISSALNGLSSGLVVFISLIAGVVAFSQGGLSGQMIAVVTLLPWASAEIISTFSLAASAKSRTTIANNRIAEFLDRKNLIAINATKKIISPSVFNVKNLKVGWGKNLVVNDLSFAVKRGEALAIIGPSGSGKSTIANALLRLIPHDGEISLDGISINDIEGFSEHVCALLQTTYIFNTSLRENLKIASSSSTDAELVAALGSVGLQDWFSQLEKGLDTLLGDSDRSMSGGEIQRIGIARAILSGASFIVLDEPTEHLDAQTAELIWQVIQREFADKGLIVITHDQRIIEKIQSKVSLT